MSHQYQDPWLPEFIPQPGGDRASHELAVRRPSDPSPYNNESPYDSPRTDKTGDYFAVDSKENYRDDERPGSPTPSHRSSAILRRQINRTSAFVRSSSHAIKHPRSRVGTWALHLSPLVFVVPVLVFSWVFAILSYGDPGIVAPSAIAVFHNKHGQVYAFLATVFATALDMTVFTGYCLAIGLLARRAMVERAVAGAEIGAWQQLAFKGIHISWRDFGLMMVTGLSTVAALLFTPAFSALFTLTDIQPSFPVPLGV